MTHEPDARSRDRLARTRGPDRHDAGERLRADARPEQITVPPDGRPREQQPPWRKDFPIDWPEDQYVARRDFTKFLVLTSLAFVVGQVWIAAQSWSRANGAAARRAKRSPRSRDLPVGAVARRSTYPGEHDPCLLDPARRRTLVAYSQKCTHLSCAVVPRIERGRAPLPVPRGLLRPRAPAGNSPARRRGRCPRHRARGPRRTTSTPPASRRGRSDMALERHSPASSGRRSSTASSCFVADPRRPAALAAHRDDERLPRRRRARSSGRPRLRASPASR